MGWWTVSGTLSVIPSIARAVSVSALVHGLRRSIVCLIITRVEAPLWRPSEVVSVGCPLRGYFEDGLWRVWSFRYFVYLGSYPLHILKLG